MRWVRVVVDAVRRVRRRESVEGGGEVLCDSGLALIVAVEMGTFASLLHPGTDSSGVERYSAASSRPSCCVVVSVRPAAMSARLEGTLWPRWIELSRLVGEGFGDGGEKLETLSHSLESWFLRDDPGVGLAREREVAKGRVFWEKGVG